MLRQACVALAALGFATPALAQEKLSRADIFSLEMAADPQISPNGDVIAYVRRSNDIMTDQTLSAIWRVDFDGDDHRPFITEDGSVSSPRWSPGGERLAYVRSHDGATQLRVAYADGSTARLATLPFGPGGIAWSPDGEHIAFTMLAPEKPESASVDIGLPDKPRGAEWAETAIVDETILYEFDGVGELPDGRSQVFVISADGGAPRQLTRFESGSLGGLSWTPDGESLLFHLSGTAEDGLDPNETDIYRIALDGGDPEQLTDATGAERSPMLSPDGRTLAWVGFENRYTSYHASSLFLAEADGSEARVLVSGRDFDIDEAVWDASGRGLWARYDERGKTHLAWIDLDGDVEVIRDDLGGLTFGRPYTSGAFSVSDNGRYAAASGSVHRLADIAAGGRRGDGRLLTAVNADVLGQRDLAEIERISWEAEDGQEIEGWIDYPPAFDAEGPYPLTLEIHGGPHTAYGPIFSAEVQLMAAAGYVVLYTNPRGSTSYGEDFANEIDKAYPGGDATDLLLGVDAVVARGFIDEERLFVTGGSGGGVLTAWLIGIDDRFAAAAVGKPVINWTSFALAADIGPWILTYWMDGTPWDNPDHYWERSPLSLVGNVTTPAMVFVGAEDRRTPVFESEQYYNALQVAGVETRLVRIPGTFHGIADSRPSRLLQKVGHILAWFEEHDPAAQDEAGAATE
jgi:dipeptidyl aminopeptidase/acylaminoacyl peptidase